MRTILVLLLMFFITSNLFGKEAIVSFYGKEHHGSKTANGKRFNMFALTAAHKSLPLGSVVIFKKGKRIAKCVINDRGPYIKGRLFDLSEAAFIKLCGSKKNAHKIGVMKVTYEITEKKQKKRKG